MKRAKHKKIAIEDRIFYSIINVIMLLVLVAVIVPLLYVISSSISEPREVLQGQVFLLPKGFSLEGYKAVFEDSRIMTGYANTIFYTVAGTALSVFLSICCAYPLSRKDLAGGNILMFVLTFTMLFSGGIVPTYILVRDLHLIDTRLAIILPGAISAYNIIIARTFFMTSIPKELLEAAQIDGCGNLRFIWSIVMPLSKSIIAVLALYYGIANWNNWFSAYLYLSNANKYPLQLVLKEILFGSSTSMSASSSNSGAIGLDALSESIKYACIMISCLPVWIMYPFVQKHFVKGVMIGSIKG
ncbi:MAG: carbohydrate ABC transporter permease [Clostridiales bacterium]|nr:carbohydrate ABC transporter permease [Clostridiales bacterium]